MKDVMNTTEPATDKQIRYLRFLLKGKRPTQSVPRIDYDTITKYEASKIIYSLVEAEKGVKRKADKRTPLITYMGEGKIEKYFDMTVDDGGERDAELLGIPWVGREEFEEMIPPCWYPSGSELPF